MPFPVFLSNNQFTPSTYATIIHYIELLGIANREIRGTYIGDYDRIHDLISGQGTFDLPCIWIESPEMTPVGNIDSSLHRWNLALSILDKGDLQNNDVNQSKYESTFRLALTILNRIQKDSVEGLIKFNIINKRLSSIDNYSANGLVGWRIELEIDTYSDTQCYNVDEWIEDIEPYNELSFHLTSEGLDPGYQVNQIKILEHPEWVYTWHVAANNNPLVPVDHPVEDAIYFIGVDYIYVQVVATRGELKREASAFVFPEHGTKHKKSVPYIYNPKNHD